MLAKAVSLLNLAFVIGWSIYIFKSGNKDRRQERRLRVYDAVALSFATLSLTGFFADSCESLQSACSGGVLDSAAWSAFSASLTTLRLNLQTVVEPFDIKLAENLGIELERLQDEMAAWADSFTAPPAFAARKDLRKVFASSHTGMLKLLVSFEGSN